MSSGEGQQVFRPESGKEERELWDSKLTCWLAAVGYVVGFGNVWCFSTGQKVSARRVGVVSVRRVGCLLSECWGG